MMTPEETLCLALSSHPGFQKTAAMRTKEIYEDYSNLSVEELEQVLRSSLPQKETQLTEKISHVDAWARQIAQADFEKTALSPVGSLLGKGINAITGSGLARRAAVGAGIGAAGGAVKHMASNDPNSSLAGNMLGGAALGAGAGAASKAAVSGLGGMNNGVGSRIRQAAMKDLHAAPPAGFNLNAAHEVRQMQAASRQGLPATAGARARAVGDAPKTPVGYKGAVGPVTRGPAGQIAPQVRGQNVVPAQAAHPAPVAQAPAAQAQGVREYSNPELGARAAAARAESSVGPVRKMGTSAPAPAPLQSSSMPPQLAQAGIPQQLPASVAGKNHILPTPQGHMRAQKVPTQAQGTPAPQQAAPARAPTPAPQQPVARSPTPAPAPMQQAPVPQQVPQQAAPQQAARAPTPAPQQAPQAQAASQAQAAPQQTPAQKIDAASQRNVQNTRQETRARKQDEALESAAGKRLTKSNQEHKALEGAAAKRRAASEAEGVPKATTPEQRAKWREASEARERMG